MVRTMRFHCRGRMGSIPGQGTNPSCCVSQQKKKSYTEGVCLGRKRLDSRQKITFLSKSFPSLQQIEKRKINIDVRGGKGDEETSKMLRLNEGSKDEIHCNHSHSKK